jgi:TonB family protein
MRDRLLVVALGLGAAAGAAVAQPAVHAQSGDAAARSAFAGEWILDSARTVLTGAPPRITGPGRETGATGVTPPVKIRDAKPDYPQEAYTSGVGGVVVLEALIDTRGSVVDLDVVRSVPQLDRAAIDAVSKWKYRPATKDGAPIPVLLTVTITFKTAGMATPPPSGPPPDAPLPAGGARAPGSGGGAGFGPPPASLLVEQDRDGFKVKRPWSGGSETAVYRFDGKRQQNRLRGLGGMASGRDQAFVSRWDGNKLVTKISWDSPLGLQQRTETMAIDGDTLVVEVSRPVPQDGAPPIVRKTVYVKKPGRQASFFFPTNEIMLAAGVMLAGRVVAPATPRMPFITPPVTSMSPTWSVPASAPSVIVRSIHVGVFVVSSVIVPRSFTVPAIDYAYLSPVIVIASSPLSASG